MFTPNWLYLAWVLAAFCTFLGGWIGAAAYTWAWRRRQVDLEYRLEDLEGRLLREVKVRASEASRNKRKIEDEILDAAAGQTGGAPAAPTLEQWRAKFFGARR